MISLIVGQLKRELSTQNTWTVLTAGGVGYTLDVMDLRMPDDSAQVTLLVHAVYREDAQLLYGFADAFTRALFRRLIDVNGVGPKSAAEMLRQAPAEHLAAWIARGDIKALSALKGIGKRTAETLVVELRDKLEKHAGGPVGGPADDTTHKDAVRALQALGLAAADARVRVDAAVKRLGGTGTPSAPSLTELITAALSGH